MAQSITVHAMLGAATLIIAISRAAALLPIVSILCAASSTSRRVCSMAIRASAMRCCVSVCSAIGRPNADRDKLRLHMISNARSAMPINRMQ